MRGCPMTDIIKETILKKWDSNGKVQPMIDEIKKALSKELDDCGLSLNDIIWIKQRLGLEAGE